MAHVEFWPSSAHASATLRLLPRFTIPFHFQNKIETSCETFALMNASIARKYTTRIGLVDMCFMYELKGLHWNWHERSESESVSVLCAGCWVWGHVWGAVLRFIK